MYKLWTVYEGKGEFCKYVVVNQQLRTIQSSWYRFHEASQVLRDLNKHLQKAAKNVIKHKKSS